MLFRDAGELMATLQCVRLFRARSRLLVARAWMTDDDGIVDEALVLAPLLCWARLYDEGRLLRSGVGASDPAGAHFVRFELPNLDPRPAHAFVLRVHLVDEDEVDIAERDLIMATS